MTEKTKKILVVSGIVAAGIVLFLVVNYLRGGLAGLGVVTNIGMSQKEAAYDGSDYMGGGDFGMPASRQGTAMMDAPVANEMFPSEAGFAGQTEDRKVIKNGNLDLRVKNTDDAARRVGEIARSQGGEVFSLQFFEWTKGSKSGQVTVRIPVANFEKAFEELKSVATQVVSESTSGRDATEEFVDLQAQLKNKRAEEEAFAGILGRTGEIDSVLKVTRELSRVRGEIERLEGRMRFLESQTDMSTITVSLSQDVEISPLGEGWRPWQVMKASVRDLIKSSQNFIDNAIRFIIVGLPMLIVYVLIVWAVYAIGKKSIKSFMDKKKEE